MECIHGRTTKESCTDCDIGHPDNWPPKREPFPRRKSDLLNLYERQLSSLEKFISDERNTKKHLRGKRLYHVVRLMDRIFDQIGRHRFS